MSTFRQKVWQKINEKQSINRPGCVLQTNVCQVCQGRGYSLVASTPFFQAELCECVQSCMACYGKTRLVSDAGEWGCRRPSPLKVVNAFNAAKIPARYMNADFSGFANFTGNGREVLNRLKNWSKTFNPIHGPGLVISGPVGIGKTYLLAAIAHLFCRQGLNVKFIDFHHLLGVIRAAYADKKSEESILRPLIGADVLIIDELGKGRNNDWEHEKLDQIVMGRYGSQKVVIASTNYKLKKSTEMHNVYNVDLDRDQPKHGAFDPDGGNDSLEARIGKRIYSRLVETSLLVEMLGDNYRNRLRPVQSESLR